MYVCPSCSEEIPDRVKKSGDECPFCHTPWPPDEADDEPAEPAEPEKPAGWGNEFRPSPAAAAAGSSATAEEPEKKSKTGLIVVILVLLIGGGGAGYYFGVVRGKGDQGTKGGAKTSSGPTEEEYSAMQSWYNQAQKVIQDYMVPVCSEYHAAGYAYYSKLVPVKSFVMRGTKREEQINFKLQLQTAGKAKGPLNVFECPHNIAVLQRDHPFVMEAKIWKRKSTFGAELNYADIEVKGKLVGYLKDKAGKPDTKFRSLANQTLEGFGFTGLKNAPDPGLQALAKTLPFKIGATSFTLANLTWKKVAPGKYIEGTWRLTVTTDDIKRKFTDWAMTCEQVKRQKFSKLSKPKAEYQTFEKIYQAGRDVMKDLCSGMEKLKGALDPWKEADANDANALLTAAHKRWNAEVYQVLLATGKKTQSVVRAKPFN